jgi:hypothetical protein
LRNSIQEELLDEADQKFTSIAVSIRMLVDKITLQKWTVHFEVNHRQSHAPREIFKMDNMNRSSVVTKTENVLNTMM